MKFRDLLGVSLRNLWRRKLRTMLTVLGVIIGTTSIVVMISLGIAMDRSYKESMEMMGDIKNITVYQSYYMGPDVSQDDIPKLTDDTIAAFEAIPGVKVVSPVVETSLKAKSGNYVAYLTVRGVRPELLQAQNLKLERGRLLEEGDQMSFLFGGSIKYYWYNPNSNNYGWYYGDDFESPVDVMNDRIQMSYDMSFGEKHQGMPSDTPIKKVKPYNVTVVGELKESYDDHSYAVYSTIEQVEKIIKEQKEYEEKLYPPDPATKKDRKNKEKTYNQAFIYANSTSDVTNIVSTVKDMGFEAYSMMEYLEEMEKQSNMIQAVLGAIGAVSLMVAALGITNTMIMSIYERTKEIGVMKVIGASLFDIGKMFLTEAAMIGFLGGGVGLLVSFGGSKLLNYLARNSYVFGAPGTAVSIIPIWLYVVAISFTTVIGLVSGFFPARRAMKLSVLKALRTE